MNGGYYDERGNGFETGNGGERHSANDGKRDKGCNEDKPFDIETAFFKAHKKRNNRKHDDAETYPCVTAGAEHERADKNDGGN